MHLEQSVDFKNLDPNQWYFQMGPYSPSNNAIIFISHEAFKVDNKYVNVGEVYCGNCNGLLDSHIYEFLKSIYRTSLDWTTTRSIMIKSGFKEKFLGFPTVETSVRSYFDSLMGWNSDHVNLTYEEYESIFNNNYNLVDNTPSSIGKPGKRIKYLLDKWLDNHYENSGDAQGQWKKLSKTLTTEGKVIYLYKNKVWLVFISVIEDNEGFHIHQFIEIPG